MHAYTLKSAIQNNVQYNGQVFKSSFNISVCDITFAYNSDENSKASSTSEIQYLLFSIAIHVPLSQIWENIFCMYLFIYFNKH